LPARGAWRARPAFTSLAAARVAQVVKKARGLLVRSRRVVEGMKEADVAERKGR